MTEQERDAVVAGPYAKPSDVVPVASKQLTIAEGRGELVFKSNCAACHSLESPISGIGPSLKGVIGRKVGSSDFAYSNAFDGRRDVWTSHRIVEFAVSPSTMYPGTVMNPVSLSTDLQRDLESYLAVSSR
jgi:cytochrome c2